MKNKLLKRSNGGFSLVELIVVIAIMAILVGVAVPVYSGYIEKSQKAKDEQMVGEIIHAIEIASVGGTWGTTYGITNNGTYIGAIVLSPDANASVQQETVIGTALHDALVQTFGSDYPSKLTLSYDGWEGTLVSGNLDAFVGSNYYGNVPTLMGDINSLTGAMKELLDAYADKVLGGGFGTWLDELEADGKVNTSDKQSVANAAILYVANNATSINKEAFLSQWKSTNPSELMLGYDYTNTTVLSAVAAEYARAEAVVNWMGCDTLQKNFSQASAGLGNIQNENELMNAFEPVVAVFTDHISGTEACQACLTKSDGNYYAAYVADPARCEKDANAYLALLGQVSNSQDKILSDIDNPNLYAEESLTTYVNNFVNVAGALSKIDAPEGTVVIVFSMNADGSIKSNAYPLDYIN